jgi:HEAT repeat protein
LRLTRVLVSCLTEDTGWRPTTTGRKEALRQRGLPPHGKLAGDPDPRAGQALAKAVSNKDWSVRAAAVEAIAKRGDPALLANIVPVMSDKKDIVRYSAAAAVLRLSRITQESGTQSH